MLTVLLLVLLFTGGGSSFAQRSDPKVDFGPVEGITAAQLRDYLYFVASDEMEGRNTPSRGLDLTAKFLALNLSRWGLKPAGDNGTFLQRIPLQSRKLITDQTSVTLDGRRLALGTDYIARPNDGQISGPLVFVGHGLRLGAGTGKELDPYKGIEVRDRIMVVIEGFPKGVSRADLRGAIGVDYDNAESYGLRNGAKGIVSIPGSFTLRFWDQIHQQTVSASRPMMGNVTPAATLPTIILSEKSATELLAGQAIDYPALKKQIEDGEVGPSFEFGPARKLSFTVKAVGEELSTSNVVAILEGSDPLLRNEYVAVGAHYDHVGTGNPDKNGDRIFNGADDDGSGTVAVLAMAEALSRGPRPKRSILFVWHTGEEKGLWGSQWFVEHPTVPLNQIIAQLNIDMIGRSRKPGDSNPRNAGLTGPDEIYVIGSRMMSSQLAELSEKVNQSYLKLQFNYKYDDPNDTERLFFRSDHYNYARKGIPIIFYFDGIHEDYHRQSDHPDKIDYEKMEKVTRTVFAKMWRLATQPERPRVDRQLPAQLAGN
ncbi:MAG: M20/M25/M40 family metallo-hydrolase [Acidobacteria bacterium]|nr:M20/M25/M40 family metallo-hydrolase [Acidobacteriota bacterium]